MKLFYQLTEDEQNDVLHHCADLVVEDMINDGVKLEPTTALDVKLKEKLEEAVKHIQNFNTKQEKIDYLMTDEFVSKAIYEIGLDLAKSAFYHQSDELVIFPDSLGDDKYCEHEEDNIDLGLNINTKKIPHQLN